MAVALRAMDSDDMAVRDSDSMTAPTLLDYHRSLATLIEAEEQR